MYEEEVRRHITFAPAPAWVKEQPFKRPPLLDQSKAPWGFYTWLVDDQARLEQRPQRYNRTIEEVVNLSALDYLANITIPFNPFFDDLCIHHVRIIRGDEVIEVDLQKRYFVMRRERSFERLVLDGRWTLAATLPDVRVGDIIDTAVTMTGDPACFQGEITMPMPLQSSLYWDRRHVRLLVPPSRQMTMKPFPMGWVEPRVTDLEDGYKEIVFAADKVRECDWEDEMPGWVIPAKGFFATSIDSWERVNDLMRAGFEGDADLPAGLREVIARIEADHANTPDRIVAAVRWVQENIRYFAFGFGEGGFVPRSLNDIFTDRIGDCKDVSKMIAAMLTRMGVESWPALVDTRRGHDLINQPPRLGAFNHCIAMCFHDGRMYWFEGTTDVAQGGDLTHMAQNDLGYALILKSGQGLVRMMEKVPQLDYEVREVIHLPKKKGVETRIDIEYVYRGARADAVRRQLRYQSLTSYVEDRCALFSYIYGMNMCAIPQMVDNRTLNEITISTEVTTDNPWHTAGSTKLFFSPESGFDYVLDDPEGHRHFPYDLGDVREGRIATLIKTDYDLDWPVKPKTWIFGGLTLAFTPRRTGEGYEAVREYIVSRPWLSADEKMDLDRAYDEITGYDRLNVRVKAPPKPRWWPGFAVRAAIWGGVPALALLAWLLLKQL